MNRLKNNCCSLAFFCLLISANHITLSASDWPQWRGEKRDGVITSYRSPQSWPERLRLKWRVTVGTGHSSPVVADGRIYLITRRENHEVISCLDLAGGKRLWQNRYPTQYVVHRAALDHGDGPKATPVLHEGKLYTIGITGIMSCLDAKTGKLMWRKEPTGGVYQAYPRFGMAISPVIVSGLMIAPSGGDRQTGALMAFDIETGEAKWRWANDRMHPEDGPEYSSPIVADIEGTPHLVTIAGKKVIGLRPSDGHLLWQFPFEADWESTVTPLFHNQMVIVSGHSIGMFALRINRCGNEWNAEQVWRNSDLFTFMNSPVAHGNLLFGLAIRNKGQYFCADVNTGKTLWVTQGREAENAAIVRGGDDLFMLTDEATLIVTRSSSRGFEPVRRYRVADSPTWAHPVVLGNQIMIKDFERLALWSLN